MANRPTPDTPSETPRPLRADAARNRRRILDAARATFAAEGLDAGVDAIARAAGVGVGTLYRRFPTKDDLLRAIVEDRVEEVIERLGEITLEDPWEAFAAATEAFADGVARDRALFELLQQARGPLLSEDAKRRVFDTLCPFLTRAQQAGVVRGDVVIEDLPILFSVAARLPAWRLERQPGLWRRYLAFLLDGLRPAGAQALPHPPPLPAPADPPAGRRRTPQAPAQP